MWWPNSFRVPTLAKHNLTNSMRVIEFFDSECPMIHQWSIQLGQAGCGAVPSLDAHIKQFVRLLRVKLLKCCSWCNVLFEKREKIYVKFIWKLYKILSYSSKHTCNIISRLLLATRQTGQHLLAQKHQFMRHIAPTNWWFDSTGRDASPISVHHEIP